jgi:hypothetical protein
MNTRIRIYGKHRVAVNLLRVGTAVVGLSVLDMDRPRVLVWAR